MNIIEIFGTNVRRYRHKLGISQEEFAEMCGLHRTYISDIECFQRNVSLENVEKIAVAFKIAPYILLKESEEDQ